MGMGHVCSSQQAPDDALRTLVRLADCCVGAITDGPLGCECWTVEYDREQAPPDESAPTSVVRAKMCEDCAYRPGSPERTGDEDYVEPSSDPRVPFWCHQGMRRAVRYRHRLGLTVESTGDYYTPAQRMVGNEMVPYQADGTPGLRCAGWAAQLAALVRSATEEA